MSRRMVGKLVEVMLEGNAGCFRVVKKAVRPSRLTEDWLWEGLEEEPLKERGPTSYSVGKEPYRRVRIYREE